MRRQQGPHAGHGEWLAREGTRGDFAAGVQLSRGVKQSTVGAGSLAWDVPSPTGQSMRAAGTQGGAGVPAARVEGAITRALAAQTGAAVTR
jgi:hypothetical protein